MNEKTRKTGALYVVASPIGNLGDLSPRALETLKKVDFILAEDSRTTTKLLDISSTEFEIISYHEHNEIRRTEELITRLISGQTAALISEAGTPGICDPGYRIVRSSRKCNIPVYSIPGPCAAIAALSISGLPSDSFYFGGFIPKKAKAAKDSLLNVLPLECTLIFYETPHRIEKTLGLISEICPNRELFLSREITKYYESSYFGNAMEIRKKLTEEKAIKGEFVLVISKETKSLL